MTSPPKVFVSHASEDKERFVIDFTTKLRANGVDAWIDEWEMLPGDSLVDRIFEEGIKNADAIIIVLSPNSVDKPWVREELNASVIQRIEGNAKIIPIVLDECIIPEALKSTVWQKISDIDEYQTDFDRILDSIFEIVRKPPIGAPPKYTQLTISTLPSLSEIDTLVFSKICEQVIEKENDWIYTRDLIPITQGINVPDEELYDSLAVLNNKNFIDKPVESDSKISFFKVTTYGFTIYAKHFLPHFDDVVTKVLISVVNQNLSSNEELASNSGEPIILVNFALEILANRGLFKIAKVMGGKIHVHSKSVEAKRLARRLSD